MFDDDDFSIDAIMGSWPVDWDRVQVLCKSDGWKLNVRDRFGEWHCVARGIHDAEALALRGQAMVNDGF